MARELPRPWHTERERDQAKGPSNATVDFCDGGLPVGDSGRAHTFSAMPGACWLRASGRPGRSLLGSSSWEQRMEEAGLWSQLYLVEIPNPGSVGP